MTTLCLRDGLISEVEKADHYRLADAYVMPGWGEGFGIVYLEAMACGMPVVASKIDGSREAVRHGALGILVDPSDQEDIKAMFLRRSIVSKAWFPRGWISFLTAVLSGDRIVSWRVLLPPKRQCEESMGVELDA